ncbi:MAG: NADH-quinone oxidoreductase subunit C [Steroidobacteraceae bacterium]
MNFSTLQKEIERHWPGQAQCRVVASTSTGEVTCTRSVLSEVCRRMVEEWRCTFAGLIVEEGASAWQLRYAFYGEGEASWVHLLVSAPLGEKVFPSVVEWIHAADWHEREAEDMFGVRFEGHPHLGDFVLHDDVWQEGVEPMRHGFNAQAAMHNRRPKVDWRPRRIVQEPGAFIMPIGPKFSGITESVHFLLETVGEDVIRSSTRLFYKWRAVEKLAEGRTVEQGLLLAERFAATTAFAHGLAFCQGVESVCSVQVPPRARALRIFLAELERLRQHASAIQEICESTALAVATSQAGLLEEELLRLSGELTGHRYLFGLLAPGGLLCDLPTDACARTLGRAQDVLKRLSELERRLSLSSSFLDRIEDVGVIAAQTAKDYSLVGPVARASGLVRDLRRTLPYAGYEAFNFDVPSEREGDGYARLRVLFAEGRQSVRIMAQAVMALTEGGVCGALQYRSGAALGWVEAPRGATFHWVRLDEGGRIARYRIVTPSFTNWHSFHLAAEKFAFQDFPIILATFDLSVAENDR